MQKQMTFGSGYFVSAAVFISCVNLIYLSVPIYIMVVYDKALYSFSRSTLYTLSVGLAVALVATVILWYLQHRMMTRAGDRMIQDTTPHVMESIRADTAGIRNTGYTRGLADLEEVRNAVAQGYLFTFLDLPWILVYLGILIIIHPVVGLLAAAAVFLTTMFQLLLKMSARKRYAAADVIQSANMKFASDCLGHARLLSGMQMLPALIRLYEVQQQPP